MKWPRRTPVFYRDGKFRCCVNRYEVDQLLAEMPGHQPQAEAECRRCCATTDDVVCVAEEGHEWALILRPQTFTRAGRGPVKAVRATITYAEIEANAGAHGLIPMLSVKRKLEHIFRS